MNTLDILRKLSSSNPYAYASIRGGTVAGSLLAYDYQDGTIIIVEAEGLPVTDCEQGIHGLHIHEGSSCETVDGVPFGGAGEHYSLTSCPHPYHTGDLPPLFSTKGIAWMAVYTDKFKPEQIIGRTIIIHRDPDDFTTQPVGHSGARIACGEIIELYR
ncbi:MAG: superoxide dismutase family protein [Coprobacillaceae bacterium]